MQPGKSKHKFFVAAAHCKTVGELRRVYELQGWPWILEKFLFASKWVIFTIDTPAARLDYARLKAAIEGRPAPAPVPISEPVVEEEELEKVELLKVEKVKVVKKMNHYIEYLVEI